MRRKSDVDIDAELAALGSLDYAALKEKWQTLFGVPAPKKIGADFLLLAIGYGIQEKASGGLKLHIRRQLMWLAGANPATTSTAEGRTKLLTPPVSLRPGVRLIREWNGETHQVNVLDGGFVWRGKTYP
ncbi:MAG: DUF2924 domain-containing protein [Proteobacteria bacterium]|nr:MAG: DUF2924 domain-containing protein [Pseudomonadota bacterium]